MDQKINQIVVAKFSGSSIAKHAKKIKEITNPTDEERKFIVVSAPGVTEDNFDKTLCHKVFFRAIKL